MSKLKFFWLYLLKHKIIIGIAVVILAVAGYFAYQSVFAPTAKASYVTSKAVKDLIVSSVSGSGTVAASSEVELKAKASSDVTAVKVKKGDTVKAGDVLIQLNAKDAAKAVRDAQTNLETAKLSLEKLQQPADQLTLLQSQNSLTQARQSKENSQAALVKAYEDAFNSISDTFLDLPGIMTDLNNILNSAEIGKAEKAIGANQDNLSALLNSLDASDRDKFQAFGSTAVSDFKSANSKYTVNFDSFKAITRYADNQTIESQLADIIETIKSAAQAAKSENNVIDVWVEDRSKNNWTIFSTVSGYQSTLNSHIGTINSHLSALLTIQQSLKSNKDAIANADQTITEKTLSLADLQAGSDALDLRSQQLSIQQKQDSLADAMEQYADYNIKAPFDGVVADVAVNLGDTVSSGDSAVTLITAQKIANLSLNEVDAAKVKVGQKAMITFDAISDLTVAGSVADVDMLGTVTQGVASYAVKIAFDSQSDQIKSGMTASASIVIDSKTDALQVPSSAVKTQNNNNYVQVLVNGAPQNKDVTVGLASDTMTEILSGISEGDEVITQTVTAGSTAAKTNTSNSGRPGGGIMMGL